MFKKTNHRFYPLRTPTKKINIAKKITPRTHLNEARIQERRAKDHLDEAKEVLNAIELLSDKCLRHRPWFILFVSFVLNSCGMVCDSRCMTTSGRIPDCMRTRDRMMITILTQCVHVDVCCDDSSFRSVLIVMSFYFQIHFWRAHLAHCSLQQSRFQP